MRPSGFGISASLAPIVALLIAQIGDHRTGIGRSSWDKEYDYIIVGAGSAGATLANRLSENPQVKVLLLEAGGHESFFTDVPILAGYFQKTPIDWAFQTVPQEHCCSALNERRVNWAQGKLLGGTSVLNYMLYVRGNRRDYDHWAYEDGAEGWSYDEVLPYFKRSQDMRDAELSKDRHHHATGGHLTVSKANAEDVSPAAKAFVESGEHLGYPIGDYNGRTQASFSVAQTTIRDGRRCSSNKAFLIPAKDRANLHVVTSALATKILFKRAEQNQKPIAYGVAFERGAHNHEVHARREVIVSSGALNSPKLLMLSGIGPGEHLKAHNISLLADLPVGENLQDHLYANVLFTVAKNSGMKTLRTATPQNLFNYLTRGRGPLAASSGCEALGFVKTKFANQTDDWPDIEIHFAPGSVVDLGQPLKRTQGLRDDFWNQVYRPVMSMDTISLLPALLKPKSRGTVRLQSADPHNPPILDPKYLSQPEDVATMIDAMKIMLKLAATPPLQKIKATPLQTRYPGCEKMELYSDEYLACMLRHYIGTFWHFSGTCRMGRPEDPKTVVDSRLRVKNVSRLRVVDASVIPTIVSANTNAASIMIGEKAADLIKEDNRKQ